MANKNINKVVIAPITVSTIACREQLHKALQPIKIDAENQAYLKSLLASAERELEKATIREIGSQEKSRWTFSKSTWTISENPEIVSLLRLLLIST